jgi:hypothetical protein
MAEDGRNYDVVVDFWDWYRRREERLNPLANYALDQCEETFRKCDWGSFAYWYEIYSRERPKNPSSRLKISTDQN